MKEWADVVSQLLERTPMILIVLGAAFFALGTSGGVTYRGWFPIPSEGGQLASCGLGVALLISAIYVATSSRSKPKASAFGVNIIYPQERDNVDVVDVRGTIRKRLPPDYNLMVFRLYPKRGNGIYPLKEVTLSADGKTWTAPGCEIGGQRTGDERIIGIYLVGPSARALLRYFREAASIHEQAIAPVFNQINRDVRYMPLITDPTEDMIRCAEVFVRRK